MNVCLVYGLVEAANILKFCIALPILISGSWAHNVISSSMAYGMALMNTRDQARGIRNEEQASGS